MSLFNKETQKSIRIVLSLSLYNQLKDKCLDYGDISRVVRHLLKEWLRNGGTIRKIYHANELLDDSDSDNSDDNID